MPACHVRFGNLHIFSNTAFVKVGCNRTVAAEYGGYGIRKRLLGLGNFLDFRQGNVKAYNPHNLAVCAYRNGDRGHQHRLPGHAVLIGIQNFQKA